MIFFGVVRQSRKPASASELGAPHYDRRCGGLRYKQVSRVRVAHLFEITLQSLSFCHVHIRIK